MRSRYALALVFLVALLGLAKTSAARSVLVGADGPTQTRYQSFIDNALVPTADTRVALHMTACPANPAAWCTNYRYGPVAIWTRADYGYLWAYSDLYSDRQRLTVQMALLHEIGHVFDLSPGPKGYRRAFARQMGRTGESWVYATSSNSTLLEQFAMAYSFCAVFPHHADAVEARSAWAGHDYGFQPTPMQYERVCHVIRNPSRWR